MTISDYTSHNLNVPAGTNIFLTLPAPPRGIVGRFLAAQSKTSGALEGFSYCLYKSAAAYAGGAAVVASWLPPGTKALAGGALAVGSDLYQVSPLYVVPVGDAIYPQPTNAWMPEAGYNVRFPYSTNGPGVTGVASSADRPMQLFVYIAAAGTDVGVKLFGYSMAVETFQL